MSFLIAVDKMVLGLCTKFSHWLQRAVGLTNFFIAKIGLFISSLSLLVDVVNYWFKIVDHKTSLFSTIFSVLILLSLAVDVHFCNKNEERLYSGKATFFRRGASSEPFFRILFLGLLFVHMLLFFTFKSKSIIEVIDNHFFIIGAFVTIYFLSVTPLPPGMSKLRKLVENFATSFRKPVPVPTSGLYDTSLSK